MVLGQDIALLDDILYRQEGRRGDGCTVRMEAHRELPNARSD
jgi:hypothetical protein